MVLYEEEVVTETRVVLKERIRLAKDTVTDEQQVCDQVRKEQIDESTPAAPEHSPGLPARAVAMR